MDDAFCIFEGGGAKGVAHVGVLAAIEETGHFNVRGYAGTSAGAIIAALAAAGWTADELFCEDANGDFHSSALIAAGVPNAIALSDLLGSQWKRLSFIRRLKEALSQPTASSRKLKKGPC